jgi:hypothetical protein
LGEQGREDRIAQTIIEDRENVVTVTGKMVAVAGDLAALDHNSSLGPDKSTGQRDVTSIRLNHDFRGHFAVR